MRDELQKVRDWANEKIAAGQEPPWAWYQYMKLRETCDAILTGMEATTPLEGSPQSALHPGAHLRLVEDTCPQGSAPHRPAGLPVQMPM
jgi:hypothetical protein